MWQSCLMTPLGTGHCPSKLRSGSRGIFIPGPQAIGAQVTICCPGANSLSSRSRIIWLKLYWYVLCKQLFWLCNFFFWLFLSVKAARHKSWNWNKATGLTKPKSMTFFVVPPSLFFLCFFFFSLTKLDQGEKEEKMLLKFIIFLKTNME